MVVKIIICVIFIATKGLGLTSQKCLSVYGICKGLRKTEGGEVHHMTREILSV